MSQTTINLIEQIKLITIILENVNYDFNRIDGGENDIKICVSIQSQMRRAGNRIRNVGVEK